MSPLPAKRKFPRQPERFAHSQQRFLKTNASRDTLIRIAPIFALQCQCALEAYYGGKVRAALFLLRRAAIESVWGMYWGILLWFSDRIGWTKLRSIWPDNPKALQRHSGKCDYHNCQDFDCCSRQWPAWFKWLLDLGSGR